MARPDTPREDFIGEGIVYRGGRSAIIGQPGTHKTRLVIVAAVSAIIGRKLGNLATVGKPLLPGHFRREKNRMQRLLYLNPEARR